MKVYTIVLQYLRYYLLSENVRYQDVFICKYFRKFTLFIDVSYTMEVCECVEDSFSGSIKIRNSLPFKRPFGKIEERRILFLFLKKSF